MSTDWRMDKRDVACYIQWNTNQPQKKKKEILLFATTWMDSEVIMLSEVSQTEKDKPVRYHLYVEYKI